MPYLSLFCPMGERRPVVATRRHEEIFLRPATRGLRENRVNHPAFDSDHGFFSCPMDNARKY
ncbi:MAG: hypothetical protein ACK2U9_20255, partial [Anaerolineae bacterium]